MGAISKVINGLTDGLRVLAMIVTTCMFLFITLAVILRQFHVTMLGDIEITELLMGTLIMLGIAYAQQQHSHISIGIVVDRLPKRVQVACDILGYVLMCGVCFIIAWANLLAALGEPRATVLLEIPTNPLRYIVTLGFLMWGLQALLSLIRTVVTGESIAPQSEH